MTGMLIRAQMVMKYWLSLPQNVASEQNVLLKSELLVFVQTCTSCVMVHKQRHALLHDYRKSHTCEKSDLFAGFWSEGANATSRGNGPLLPLPSITNRKEGVGLLCLVSASANADRILPLYAALP